MNERDMYCYVCDKKSIKLIKTHDYCSCCGTEKEPEFVCDNCSIGLTIWYPVEILENNK